MTNKKNKDVEYRTSDIQALYGLSNKGLFYYEEKGLIAPKRLENSRYRVYTLQETARLHRCKIYRQYGFSVDESISMVSHVTAQALCDALSRSKQEATKKIIWCELLMEQIQKNTEAIQLVETGAIPMELRTRPPMYRVALRQITQAYEHEDQRTYQQWQDLLPIADASLLINHQKLDAACDEMPVNLGFIVDKASMECLDHNVTIKGEALEPIQCLYTIIHGQDDVLNDTQRIRPALVAMDEMGYCLCGDPVTRMFATFDAGQGMQRFDHAWFPVKRRDGGGA